MPSNTTFAFESIDGGTNPQGRDKAAPEAVRELISNQQYCVVLNSKHQNLDIQYTVGLATGVPVTFFSVGNDTTDDSLGFLDIVDHLMNKTSPPQVSSFPHITRNISGLICNSVLIGYEHELRHR